MTKSAGYCEHTIINSYAWLGHHSTAFTELNAIDPNRRKPTAVAYVNSIDGVLDFVDRHHKDRLLCWGANERPEVLLNSEGFARCARNDDIQYVSNFVIDIDLTARPVTDSDRTSLKQMAGHEFSDYFTDLGLRKPVYADTGRGGHELFAAPRTPVSECPDISDRFHRFSNEFAHDLGDELARIGAKIDPISDLRRVLRIYGTAKPDVGYISKFYGNERVEDEELLVHLQSYDMEQTQPWAPGTNSFKPCYGPALITIYNETPPLFGSLIKRDKRLRDLYEGTGRTKGDLSGSGYDLALARRMLALGISDISLVATVLAHRPKGSVQKSGKGESYLRATVARAISGK